MTKQKHELWYKPIIGEYHDILEEGCLAYIKQTGLVDFYSGSYGDIDKVSVNGETYHAQDVFPSKIALVESLLTPEEREEMAGVWLGEVLMRLVYEGRDAEYCKNYLEKLLPSANNGDKN